MTKIILFKAFIQYNIFIFITTHTHTHTHTQNFNLSSDSKTLLSFMHNIFYKLYKILLKNRIHSLF